MPRLLAAVAVLAGIRTTDRKGILPGLPAGEREMRDVRREGRYRPKRERLTITGDQILLDSDEAVEASV